VQRLAYRLDDQGFESWHGQDILLSVFNQPPTNASVKRNNFVIIFVQYSWYGGTIFNLYYEYIM
jgi:hypothetical protein